MKIACHVKVSEWLRGSEREERQQVGRSPTLSDRDDGSLSLCRRRNDRLPCMLNYSHLIDRKPPRTDASPPRHPALPSNPVSHRRPRVHRLLHRADETHAHGQVLVKSLPRTSEISKRAEQYAHSARKQHILNDALTSAVETPLDARPAPSADDKQLAASSDGAAGTAPATTRSGPGKRGGGPYEPFEVLRAIEKKDLAVILDVKSHQFDLLVTAGPGQPLPLVYAIRMGKSHADMAIVIVGAISRRVNDTSDDELAQKDPRTLATLRAIRANLKIAISASLSGPDGDTSLLSSFLYVFFVSQPKVPPRVLTTISAFAAA